MHSLRKRAIRGATMWAGITIIVSFIALISFFNAYSVQRFDNQLASHHRQMVIALGNSGGELNLINQYIDLPEYHIAFSGTYWQLTSPNGRTYVSPSMLDSKLELPPNTGPEIVIWEGEGPGGRVRGMHQRVALGGAEYWIVSVAQSLAGVDAERTEVRRGLLVALILIGAMGVTGVALQLSVVLRPLALLREDVESRWQAGETLDPTTYPEEVAPLVSDINLLLSRNRGVIDSSRRQAADLAHALKTPTAVLRNYLEKGQRKSKRLDQAKEALDRIDAQILRSLARIRAGNAAASANTTDLATSCERLARLFRAMPSEKPISVKLDVPQGLSVAIDRQDLEEVLGNLLENALNWNHKIIHISAWRETGKVVIFVDDDGPGIPEAKRADVMNPGQRLDVSAPGTGLGLAIVKDLITAYGGTIELSDAPELGGLRVILRLPYGGHPLRLVN